MRLAPAFLLAVCLAAQNLAPPPWIRQGGVVNAAGRLPFTVPGGGLAPGALVAIEGLRFAPGKVTVEAEAGGRVYPAKVLSASPERIIAQLPDFRFVGAARIFVRAGGHRSEGAEVRLVGSAFGIFTLNGQGWGSAARVENPAAVPLPLGVVHAGERITLSGTGLGKSGAGDIEVLVGNHRAEGVRRSEKNGVEQLTFEIPRAAPQGCGVPVVVRTGPATSNSATISIGPGACDQTPTWYEQIRSPGRRTGVAVLLRSDAILELTPGKPVHFQVDNLLAGFHARPAGGQVGIPDVLPPAGDCETWAGPIDANHLALPTFLGPTEEGIDLGPEIEDRTSGVEDLDAGGVLRVIGRSGARRGVRSAKKPHLYSAILGGDPPVTRIPPTPLFLLPGLYKVELPGGKDVKAVTATVEVPESIQWLNRAQVGVVDRLAGVDLEWSMPPGYTALAVVWNIDRRNGFGGVTLCRAPLKATRFRIPATAIGNLPVTALSGSDLSLGFAGVAAVPIDPVSLGAPDLDYSRVAAVSFSGRTVVIK